MVWDEYNYEYDVKKTNPDPDFDFLLTINNNPAGKEIWA